MVTDAEYRVRGLKTGRGIRWCAQKRVRWLCFTWWWPLTAITHSHPEQAWHDVEYDQLAVPPTQYVKPEPSERPADPPLTPRK